MAPEDDGAIRRIVHKQLMGVRWAGVALAGFGFLPALALAVDEQHRLRGHNPINVTAWIVVGALVVVGLVGVWLFRKGRDVTGASLYRLLTSESHRIETLKFVRVVNRPWVFVYLGVGGKEIQVSVLGEPQDAMALFNRVAPRAMVLRVRDPRVADPSTFTS